jgi:hypothetical protein
VGNERGKARERKERVKGEREKRESTKRAKGERKER